MDVIVQNVVYFNLKGLFVCEGDMVVLLKVEKCIKNYILMIGGVDYKISVGLDDFMCKYLKFCCYVVQVDIFFYVNCKRLCYKKFCFGGWYVFVLCIGDYIYFSVIFLGFVVVGSDVMMDVMLGG